MLDWMLGSGKAKKTAEELRKRKSRLDEAVEGAVNPEKLPASAQPAQPTPEEAEKRQRLLDAMKRQSQQK